MSAGMEELEDTFTARLTLASNRVLWSSGQTSCLRICTRQILIYVLLCVCPFLDLHDILVVKTCNKACHAALSDHCATVVKACPRDTDARGCCAPHP